jgi:folate-binding protein YgfZ
MRYKSAQRTDESFPMTETVVALTPQATALALLLESAATPHELCAYKGALTPRELDAPERETDALATGAAVHDLGWLKRVAVRGEDRFRWLSGMVTNMVNGLEPNTGAWNLVLNAQGRIKGDLYVWREGEQLPPHLEESPAGDSELVLQIASDQYERLMAHLERFIIMDDVELTLLSGEAALGLTGPLGPELLGRLGLPAIEKPLTEARVEWNGLNLRIVRGYGVLVDHYELWTPVARLGKLWKALRTAGATPVGSAAVDAFRIAEAIPAFGIDMVERDLPQETSQLRALHFSKGCYLGQEIVERIRSRGNVHRHLRQLELTGSVPASGTELTAEGGVIAGHITSAAELKLASGSRVFALGMLKGEAEARNLALAYSGGTARILASAPEFETS